jgi:hypothetical protein
LIPRTFTGTPPGIDPIAASALFTTPKWAALVVQLPQLAPGQNS